MKTIDLGAERRTSLGSGASRRYRRAGSVPAVLYAHGEPASILVDERSLNKTLHTTAGSNMVLNIKIKGLGDQLAIIRDIQRHPVTRRLAHVDFLRVSLTEKIATHVQIELVGTAPAVKFGGLVVQMLREVEIEATPLDIPEIIQIDISKLENLYDAIHVSQIPLAPGVEMLTDGDVTVVLVQAPKAEEVAVPAVEAEGAVAEGGTAQPEVVAKGKEKEEKAS